MDPPGPLVLLVPWSCWSSGPLVRWSSGPPGPLPGRLVRWSSCPPGPLPGPLVLWSPRPPGPVVLFWSFAPGPLLPSSSSGPLLPLGRPGQPVVSFPTQAILASKVLYTTALPPNPPPAFYQHNIHLSKVSTFDVYLAFESLIPETLSSSF